MTIGLFHGAKAKRGRCDRGVIVTFILLLTAGLIVGGISCVLTKALFAALPSSAGQQRKGSPFKN